MKKEFSMSVREIVKETVIASITVAVLTILAYTIAWPALNWYSKRRKEKESVPSPESFENVQRADDVHFTEEEDHPVNQDGKEESEEAE